INFDYSIYTKGKNEIFRSFYVFDEEIIRHFNAGYKTLDSYKGKFYITELIIDVDKGKDSENYLIDKTKEILNYIIKDLKLENNFKLFYSGTGFHIHFPNIFNIEPSKDLPLILKETMSEYFKGFNIDLSIYNKRSIIRLPYSYNSKSGLYKVEINEDELYTLNIEQIKEKCKNINVTEPLKPVLDYNEVEEKFLPVAVNKDKNIINGIEPNNVVVCMQKLYNEGEKVGTRHISILRLASWLMRNGIPIDGTIAMLKKYTPSLDEYELERTVRNVYEKKYMYGCDDEIMKKYCDSRCIFFNKKNYLSDVFDTSKLEHHYVKYVNSMVEESAINLKNYFTDIKHDFYLIPGNLIGIIGDTGINKSSFMQNLCIKIKDKGNILYVNTEMSNIELFERFMMIAYDIDREMIREHYKNNNNTLGNIISHVFYTNSTPNFDGLRDLVIKFRPSILIVDVIDDIFPKQLTLKDDEFMFMELKNMARIYNLIVFLVHHISKSGAKGELNKHSGKGSSAFEQKCDVVIGIDGDNKTTKRIIKVLKGRSYSPFEISVDINNKYRILQLWQQ
ncbi:MAG: AAA family ATPase, partial [Candidatus Omnitrophica bacterium]|nr:AAA family ATPase [Candidatus Omnitrophota bacterium]